MLVTCLNCNTEFDKLPHQIRKSPKHFCCRSCSASFNNKAFPKRIKETIYYCSDCSVIIDKGRKRCSKCCVPKDYTLEEIIYDKHHKSSSYALVRFRSRSLAMSLGWSKCVVCGYDKHVEIAHIKPIADYPLTTKISVVNHTDNLAPLCPNHHWEFDKGLIELPDDWKLRR